MLLDPLQGHRLNFLQVIVGVVHAAVALDLTHLLTHSRTEQRLLIGKRDAHQIAFFAPQAPRHVARITNVGIH
ncbi:hypothetical protein D3C81_1888440 [compost metagenome]